MESHHRMEECLPPWLPEKLAGDRVHVLSRPASPPAFKVDSGRPILVAGHPEPLDAALGRLGVYTLQQPIGGKMILGAGLGADHTRVCQHHQLILERQHGACYADDRQNNPGRNPQQPVGLEEQILHGTVSLTILERRPRQYRRGKE